MYLGCHNTISSHKDCRMLEQNLNSWCVSLHQVTPWYQPSDKDMCSLVQEAKDTQHSRQDDKAVHTSGFHMTIL